MKTALKIVFVIMLIAAPIAVWVARIHYANEQLKSWSFGTDIGDNEKYPHKLARYRSAADEALLAACTNYTVGLRSILYQRVETYDNNFMKWTAKATVEFINPVGGVERTNLDFGSSPIAGRMDWLKK
jgi:hypothetical protein